MEKQARMRVGGMCELLRRILVRAHEVLANKQVTDEQRKSYAERVERLVVGFPPYLEEAIEVMKLPIPLDPEKIGPIMAAYARAFAPLRDHLEAGKGDRAAVCSRARREGGKALMELIPILKNRKRAYRFSNELSLRFRGLIDLLGRGAEDEALKKALKFHDDALLDFKKFAKLK